MTGLAALLLGSIALGAEDERDRVTLADGKEIRGRVWVEGKERIFFSEKGRERWIPREKIQALDTVNGRMRKFLDESAALEDADVIGRLALAERMLLEYCRRGAELEAWRVLEVDPRASRAHEILGHKKRAGEWQLPFGQDWVSLADAIRLRSDWGKAWEFDSEHFSFRSNRNIFDAAKLAQDLERYYLAILQLLAPAEPEEILKPFSVHVYRDEKDFPKIGLSIGGYFQRVEDRAYIYYPGEDRALVIYHEMAHGILHHAISRKKDGSIPPWADEGLAEYLAGCVQGQPGRIRFEEGAKIEAHFRLLRNEKDLFGIKGTLNFSANDFLSSSKRELRYAQVYGFCYLFFHGDDRRLRGGFFDFLQECHRGSASPTRLFQVLGLSAEALEERWLSFLGRRK